MVLMNGINKFEQENYYIVLFSLQKIFWEILKKCRKLVDKCKTISYNVVVTYEKGLLKRRKRYGRN